MFKTPTNKIKMTEMTQMEFNSKIANEDITILPIGACEQHGPHLPLSVDTVLANGFAERLAERVNGMVAPAINYGYRSKPLSGGGPLFPGTVDLSGETQIHLTYDILEELIKDGVKNIMVLSCHFENEAFVCEAVDLVTQKYGDRVKILIANWWDPMPADIIDKVFDEVPFPGWAFEHAAVTETSLMMAFAPELVHEERMVDTKGATPCPYHIYPVPEGAVPETGVLAPAKSSTAARGQLIIDSVLDELVKICKKEFNK